MDIKRKSERPRNIHVILFLATLVTTFLAGYVQSLPLVKKGFLHNPLEGAIPFSIGLIVILGCHEMGHKLMANRRNIRATFPYFIPAPTIVGTFGAVINMKGQVPDRNSLFDVGAAGPIGGLLAIVPVTILGLRWSFPVSAAMASKLGLSSRIGLGEPLLFKLLKNVLLDLPLGSVLVLHPLAFAGWVGMLVTMLNLMPIGMLDGGHISRALIGNKICCGLFQWHKVVSILGAMAMALLGYWLMAMLILFFLMFPYRGPVDEKTPLSRGRKWLAIGLFLVLILCATPLHF